MIIQHETLRVMPKMLSHRSTDFRKKEEKKKFSPSNALLVMQPDFPLVTRNNLKKIYVSGPIQILLQKPQRLITHVQLPACLCDSKGA